VTFSKIYFQKHICFSWNSTNKLCTCSKRTF